MVEKTNQIKEFKRICKECGAVWHSLESREKEIENQKNIANLQEKTNACACNSNGNLLSRRNSSASQDSLDKLRSCPKCGSHNYTEEIKTYEKK